MCAVCFCSCFLGFSFLIFSNYRWRRWRTDLRRIKANWSRASASGKEKKENESQENGASAHLLTPPVLFKPPLASGFLHLEKHRSSIFFELICSSYHITSIVFMLVSFLFLSPFPLSVVLFFTCVYIFLNWWETIYMRIYFCLHISLDRITLIGLDRYDNVRPLLTIVYAFTQST